MSDDGFKRVWDGSFPHELIAFLTPEESTGLLALAKELNEEVLDDPDEYGYGRSDFDGTDQEYESMLKEMRDYGRLANMDTYIVFRHPDGRVSVNTIMTMSHVDRYHRGADGRWTFEE